MCLSQKKYHFFKSCALGARSVTFLISLCLSEHAPELSPSDRNPYTRYRAVAARDTRYRQFSFFAASVKGCGVLQLIEFIQQERVKRIKEMERIYKMYYPW